ncbi:MAG: tRNA (adenosine(37)-N6)-dimethylallyltransferase MiaA [Rhodospirillales bacterium]|nr:tRNA (adenosine(37)-N6)-dimethylallyltransferase MiaA [Rhodospirillales bacterium]
MRTGADRPLPLIIAGPSGSGKSALAIDVAEATNGVIINADSMQLYRELRILTARPSPTDEARVPHRLYGILPAAEAGCVADWLGRALAEIETARGGGRTPIIVGGSGLYLRALRQGLSPMPPIPADVRAEARTLFADLGEAEFRRRLSRLDAEAAARRQRLIRAYEVAAATGRTVSAWQRMAPPVPPLNGPVLAVALLPARPPLASILDHRFDAMIDSGAVAEVRALLDLRLDPTLPAMKALGATR